MSVILVFPVLSAALLAPFVLLYGYLYVQRPGRLELAGNVRFGVIGGPLISPLSSIGDIVAATQVESIQTPFGTVKSIAFVDAFALGVVFGVLTGEGSTVLLLQIGRE